jgi:hypothetical protein
MIYSVSGNWLLADGSRVLYCAALPPAEMMVLCAKYQADADAPRVKDLQMCATEKAAELKRMRGTREVALNRIAGLHLTALDTVVLTALASARVSLLGITSLPAVLAAPDGGTTRTALGIAWNSIAATLTAAAPSAANVFNGLEM